MKRSILVLLLVFLISVLTSAQEIDSSETYFYTFREISVIMNDLKLNEPDNYDYLLSDFNEMKRKRSSAFWTGSSVIAGGVVLGIVGIFLFDLDTISPYISDVFFAAGGLALGSGISLMSVLGPEKEDPNRLVSLYNKQNPDNQITSFSFKE